MIVFDASVIIAFREATHPRHDEARAIVQSHVAEDFCMSVVTAAEAMVHRARLGQLDEARAELGRLGIVIKPVPAEVAASLAALRATKRLKMPDVIVLDLALRRRATLVTFDGGLAQAAREAGLEVRGG